MQPTTSSTSVHQATSTSKWAMTREWISDFFVKGQPKPYGAREGGLCRLYGVCAQPCRVSGERARA